MSRLAGAARVRPARPRDLDRLAALFTLLADHHARKSERYAFQPPACADSAVRDWLARRLGPPEVRLAVFDEGGQLLGFCCTTVADRPPPFRAARRGEIEHLFVRPEARRRGIGGTLVSDAQRWLRQQGADRVTLQVAVGNGEGRAFWDALGFGRAMDVLDRPL